MLRILSRLRFSLRTFLVTLFVLSLIGSNLNVSFKWRQAQGEIQRLRDELGYLTTDDPTRFYVRAAPTHESLAWRWRIYVPSDAVICIAKREIPERGVTRAEHIGVSEFFRGEQVLDVRLDRREYDGGFTLFASGVNGSTVFVSMAISRDEAPWLYEPDENELNEDDEAESNADEQPETLELAGSDGRADSFSFDAPVVLLRLRHPRKHQSIHEDCDGLMIWFEKHRDPRQKGNKPASPAGKAVAK